MEKEDPKKEPELLKDEPEKKNQVREVTSDTANVDLLLEE